ncbi:MAG: hypothetical protein Sapg2KO_13410 [Saprospiraceae bacterium]
MKRLLITFSLLIAANFIVAQNTINPKIGYNYSYFSGDYDDRELEGQSGWQVGVDFKFGDQFYFAPGVHYFQSTALIESVRDINVTGNDIEFDIRGIRVPAVLGVDLIEGKRLGLRAYTGPNVSFILDNDEDAFDTSDALYNEFILGYNAGVGLDIGIFTVDVEHEWGLSNAFDSDLIDSRNNRLFLSVGLLF